MRMPKPRCAADRMRRQYLKAIRQKMRDDVLLLKLVSRAHGRLWEHLTPRMPDRLPRVERVYRLAYAMKRRIVLTAVAEMLLLMLLKDQTHALLACHRKDRVARSDIRPMRLERLATDVMATREYEG